MSKKTITIEVPDGLPDGWECCGYGDPVAGETMHHSGIGWIESSGKNYKPIHLIARRTETAADWANKQPKLVSFAGMVKDGARLEIWKCGQHVYEDEEGGLSYIYAESCPESYNGLDVEVESGKWINA